MASLGSNIIVVAILTTTIAACAKPNLFAPIDPEMRSSLGVVGIVPIPISNPDIPETPTKGAGEGALTGAAQGGVGSVAVGGSACQGGEPITCAAGLAVGIAFAIPSAIVGAGVGAVRSRSPEEVNVAAAQIETKLVDLRVTSDIRDRIMSQTGEIRDIAVRSCDLNDFACADRSGDRQDPNTALEISMRKFYLRRIGALDPDLQLEIAIKGRLIRLDDRSQIFWREWRYQGPEKNYFEMAANEAALLSREIQHAYGALAKKIIFDIFFATEPEEKLRDQTETVSTTAGPVLAEDRQSIGQLFRRLMNSD